MDTLEKNLEQREKAELIAIIQHILRHEPELQWLVNTPLPTASFRKASIDPEPESWVFKFKPGQRLRALFGWSSTYSG